MVKGFNFISPMILDNSSLEGKQYSIGSASIEFELASEFADLEMTVISGKASQDIPGTDNGVN